MEQLTVAADDKNLETVQDFVRECIGFFCYDVRILMQIDLAVEEIFVNISHYAYADGGDVRVTCDISGDAPVLRVVFADSGKRFDPLVKPDPDITAGIEDRKIGGLGIFLTKKYMDSVSYEYRDGQNILTMIKSLRSVSPISDMEDLSQDTAE